MFRQKTMHVEEWAPLQDRFGEWFMAMKGDKRLALFIRDTDDPVISTLLIPNHQAEIVEAFSPGGWEDASDAREHGWGLLVGNSSAFEDHGLRGSAIRETRTER